MSFLTPCEGCHRHVLASESRCPFCAAPVTKAMRTPRASRVRSGVGRAGLLVLSATAAACGGESDDDGSREQASQADEPAKPAGDSTVGAPTPTTPGSLPDTGEPMGGQPTATPDDDEPMAVAEYGVPILPPNAPPTATAPVDPPPPPDPGLAPVYGAPAIPMPSTTAPTPPAPGPMVEPDVVEAPDAGASVPAMDAGAEAEDAAAEVEPSPEPEPLVQPAYGVGILPATE